MAINSAISQILAPPLARALMQSAGWHNAYVAFGAAELLISFPILFVFFRERRTVLASGATQSGGEVRPDGAPPIRLRQAVSGKTYWMLIGAQLAGQFGVMGIGTHAVGLLGEHGVTPALATWGLSVFAAGALAGQFATGYLLDRFDTPRVIMPFAATSLLGLLTLHATNDQNLALIVAFVIGLGLGGETSITSYFTTRYFGVRNFSTIYGSLIPVLFLCGAPAAAVIGIVFDRTGSYNMAMIVLEAIFAVSLIFFILLEPYRYPVKTVGRKGDAITTPTMASL